MSSAALRRVGILTSGGDAQGMNAAVRAVVRAGIRFGAQVFAIHEGYQGVVDGGAAIQAVGWEDVSGIQHRGGTVIGTARCAAFREREGRKQAARHLAERGIDRLVVVGGDGSLTGANLLASEWPHLLGELAAEGALPASAPTDHPVLHIAGVVGSIDNDMVGTDMTIGADSAMHRIVEALDAIASTAASHQRTFVVEVMGRRCGYLALTAAIAGGADFALIPEAPPGDGWEDELCDSLRRARARGRRESIIILAEGARDRSGQPITTDRVCAVLEQRFGEQPRVTILGHVQRGGTPSAFDRSMATMMGYDAVDQVLTARPGDGAQLVGVHRNRVRRVPLMRAVYENQAVARMIDEGRYDDALAARGDSYAGLFGLLRSLSHPRSEPPRDPKRIAVLHAGGLAPGMNAVVRAATLLGGDAGHEVLGVQGGFTGLCDGHTRRLTPRDVDGWAGLGGAELGSRRGVLAIEQLYAVARAIDTQRIDALLVVGGFDAYESAHRMVRERGHYSSLEIPIACVPATIDNNLPGTELTVGADTALNAIVESIDRIKQSALAAHRCFVIEVMGRECGYLTLMSALSAGAERAYLPEEELTLTDLAADVRSMTGRFRAGHGLFLAIRAEDAHPSYTTDVLAKIFAAEADGLYDVREAVLGHVQQGGNPTPFDRVLAARLASGAIDALTASLAAGRADAVAIGLDNGEIAPTPLARIDDLVDWGHRRPRDQWWLRLRRVMRDLAEPGNPAPSGAQDGADQGSGRHPG